MKSFYQEYTLFGRVPVWFKGVPPESRENVLAISSENWNYNRGITNTLRFVWLAFKGPDTVSKMVRPGVSQIVHGNEINRQQLKIVRPGFPEWLITVRLRHGH